MATTAPAKAPFKPDTANAFKGTMTQQQIETYMRNYASAVGQPYETVKNMMNLRPHYEGGRGSYSAPAEARYDVSLPAIPKKAAAPVKPTTVKPVVKPVVKPTGPKPETPHEKALRLAREGGTSAYTRQYSDLALPENDPYGVNARFNRLLEESLKTVPATDNDVTKYVNYNDLFSKATNEATTAERNKLSSAFKTATPYGWQDNYFQDTSDDAILRQILGTQATDTSTNLKRQLDRGQMSQGAYDYAIGQLGYDPAGQNYTGLSAGAYQTLQGLGGGVLSGYRTGLGDTANEFSNLITNYSLGSNVDPSLLSTNLTNKANTYRGGMEGDIRKALGNTQLFDPNKLIATAGNASGVSNQPVQGSTPQGTGRVLTEDEQRSQGTSGVF